MNEPRLNLVELRARMVADGRLPAEEEPTARQLAAQAAALSDEWEAWTLAIIDESRHEERLRAANAAFRTQWPALVHWTGSVLKHRRNHPVGEVAAALEATGVECSLAGETGLAARARRAAMRVILGGRGAGHG